MDTTALRIHRADNVAVALREIARGETSLGVTAREVIPVGHKMALSAIAPGGIVYKYGYPIGLAKGPIAAGDWMHTHNCRTGLDQSVDYRYKPNRVSWPSDESEPFFGYRRSDGRVGIRNEVWIIPTVGCVNQIARGLAAEAARVYGGRVDGIYALEHPNGCSQLGEDHERTQRTLAALARHPNAAAALVLGLGCENNHIAAFQKIVGSTDPERIAYLSCQNVSDEWTEAMRLLERLTARAERDRRVPCRTSDLVIGLKCGGSDGFSGITANPLLGRVTDRLTAQGGISLLTEVPEMFGAEQLLMSRCVSREVFEKTRGLIDGFKAYFKGYGQPVYENPSPGNKDGGITTLEEKSLGCVQKGGSSPVTDVLPIGMRAVKAGLNLVDGPGNDLCAVTALACAGAQVILFTSGRGTPLGSPVPTLKVATNSGLAEKKPHWIDFDAGTLLAGMPMPEAADALWGHILRVVSGEGCKNERYGDHTIAIFRDGVTL